MAATPKEGHKVISKVTGGRASYFFALASLRSVPNFVGSPASWSYGMGDPLARRRRENGRGEASTIRAKANGAMLNGVGGVNFSQVEPFTIEWVVNQSG